MQLTDNIKDFYGNCLFNFDVFDLFRIYVWNVFFLWLNVSTFILSQISRHAWCHRLPCAAAAVWQCQKEAVEYRSAGFIFIVWLCWNFRIPNMYHVCVYFSSTDEVSCCFLVKIKTECDVCVQVTGFGQWLMMPGGLGPLKARSPTRLSILTACFSATMSGTILSLVYCFVKRYSRVLDIGPHFRPLQSYFCW